MKIRFTRSTICDGQTVQIGQEVATDDRTGRYLVQIGKAVRVVEVDPVAGVEVAAVAAPEHAARGKGSRRIAG